MVDWIDTSLPSAVPVYSPVGVTTGNVKVSLTSFSNHALKSISFSGNCLFTN